MQQSDRVLVASDTMPALDLVARLCRTLETEGVSYCHWKSNEALDRSASGENDLDLLIRRGDGQRFTEILRRLGFKEALLPPVKHLPGVFHAYGLDEGSGRLVHIHAHYQLVLGDDMTKNYRLPIEAPYLDSAAQGALFRVPAPEFELAVFLIRMVLKHATWDAVLTLQGSLTASEKRELESLTHQADAERMRVLMARHLPFIDDELWDRCLASLKPRCSTWFRTGTAGRLQRALAGHARRPWVVDAWLKTWRRGRAFVRRRILGAAHAPKRLDAGGALIALVGGDGAGKSTAVTELLGWLSKSFHTVSVHLGKPRRSATSTAARAVWERGRALNPSAVSGKSALLSAKGGSIGFRAFARLIWEVMTARDRYREYAKARRLASNGAIVICDRYPLPQIKLMDGAAATRLLSHPNRAVRYLARREQRYYEQVLYPDLLIVLRVRPDLAVERKREEEGEAFVRPRSEEIWQIDWRGTPAVVIDAGRPKAEVLAQIKSLVWSRL